MPPFLFGGRVREINALPDACRGFGSCHGPTTDFPSLLLGVTALQQNYWKWQDGNDASQ
jgi:hypothetical protein